MFFLESRLKSHCILLASQLSYIFRQQIIYICNVLCCYALFFLMRNLSWALCLIVYSPLLFGSKFCKHYGKLLCRQNGCAWLDHLDICMKTCLPLQKLNVVSKENTTTLQNVPSSEECQGKFQRKDYSFTIERCFCKRNV